MTNLIKLAKNNGFEYDKVREIALGRKEGYYIILKELTAKRQILIKMNLKNNTENNVDINQFLYKLDQDNKFVEAATYNDNEALIIISGSRKKIIENVNTVIDKTISFCKSNNIKNACMACGDSNSLSIYGVGETADVLCHKCYSTVKIDIQENISKTNYPMGIVGAFLGSLIGVALWIIIYQLGYIAGIAGAAMVIFAFKGFKMLGKELPLGGVICSIIISFIMVPLSVYLSWSIDLFKYYGEGLTFSDCASSLIYIMVEEEEVMGGMVGEMLMGYVLYFAASVSVIIKTIKSAKVQHKTEVLVGK